MNEIIHNHHILPIRLGGSEDPFNRKLVTIKEHAKLHEELWLKYQDRRDWVAWKGLSGQINKDEMIYEILHLPKTGKGAKGHKKSEETKQKMRKPKSPEHRQKVIDALSGDNHWTKHKTPDTTQNINKLLTCSICGETTTAGNIGRWHNEKCRELVGNHIIPHRNELGQFSSFTGSYVASKMSGLHG